VDHSTDPYSDHNNSVADIEKGSRGANNRHLKASLDSHSSRGIPVWLLAGFAALDMVEAGRIARLLI